MKTVPLIGGTREDSGYMLLVLVAGIVPLSILAAAMTSLLASRATMASMRLAEERLLSCAEGITQEGLARLNLTTSPTAFALAASTMQHAVDGIDNDRDGVIDEVDEIGEVRVVSSWIDDGLDNDGDGRVDEDDENVVCFLEDRLHDRDLLDNDGDGTTDEPDENYSKTLIGVARPFLQGSRAREKKVFTYVQYTAAVLPPAAAALYLGDPNAELAFNGTSFRIDGRNVDINGNRVPGDVPGIGVTGSTSSILDELRSNQSALVEGLGGSPSVHAVQVPNPFGSGASFIPDMIATYAATADIHLGRERTVRSNAEGSDGLDNDGDGRVDEEDESWFGTLDSIKVVYASGDVKFSGTTRGAGILLVDGSLEISGQFLWEGMIIVAGDLKMSGGGSQGTHLIGAAYIGAGIEGSESSTTIGGNSVIQYSQEVLDRLTGALGRYRFWAFKEQ